MSRWNSAFESQEVILRVQRSIEALESAQIDGLPDADMSEYARLLKVLRVISARMAGFDPEMFSVNTWGNFANWLSTVENSARNFAQSRNASQLQTANNHVDNVLNALGTFDTEATIEEFKSIAEASFSFQQKFSEELERFRNLGNEVKHQLDSLAGEIAQTKLRLDENNQTIQQQKGRLDQSIADFQKQFSEAQETRTKEFAQAIKENTEQLTLQRQQFTDKFAEASSQQKTEYETFLTRVREENQEHLDFLKKREDEVNKIFGAIGSTAFAGNFKTTADTEAGAANLWRWIALGLMAAMILLAGYAFYYSIEHATDWKLFAFRLGTIVVLAIPAAYAANESSKHRERERLNRKIHLELASIDAYLVLLPETERNKIKANLAERFFGVPTILSKEDAPTQKDWFGVLTNVLNNLTKGK